MLISIATGCYRLESLTNHRRQMQSKTALPPWKLQLLPRHLWRACMPHLSRWLEIACWLHSSWRCFSPRCFGAATAAPWPSVSVRVRSRYHHHQHYHHYHNNHLFIHNHSSGSRRDYLRVGVQRSAEIGSRNG